MAQNKPLSEARLAEIRAWASNYHLSEEMKVTNYLRDLLAEVERRRAREAALVAKNNQAMVIVEALDALGWDAFIGRELWEQARALLAEHANGEVKNHDADL